MCFFFGLRQETLPFHFSKGAAVQSSVVGAWICRNPLPKCLTTKNTVSLDILPGSSSMVCQFASARGLECTQVPVGSSYACMCTYVHVLICMRACTRAYTSGEMCQRASLGHRVSKSGCRIPCLTNKGPRATSQEKKLGHHVSMPQWRLARSAFRSYLILKHITRV